MCRALARPEWIDDERFVAVSNRSRNVVARRALMSEELGKWPSAEILARLRAENVPCAPVLSRTELMDDEQVRTNGILEIHDDPVLGAVRQPRPAARFSATPAAVRKLAPFLGADNTELLTEPGYSAREIVRLTEADVLHAQPPPAEDQARNND
jgi:crotonobetainyl-CoA:carnitine CoA-transferase CaiB-like acyl-CoA transferase